MKEKRIGLMRERDSIRRRLAVLQEGCLGFLMKEKPEWAYRNSILSCYYRNCRWSGTWVVLYTDSTFQYVHNGEGSANFASMGRWQTKDDSLFLAILDETMSSSFQEHLNIREGIRYRNNNWLQREFILHKTGLEFKQTEKISLKQ